jgi:hypothetical protein
LFIDLTTFLPVVFVIAVKPSTDAGRMSFATGVGPVAFGETEAEADAAPAAPSPAPFDPAGPLDAPDVLPSDDECPEYTYAADAPAMTNAATTPTVRRLRFFGAGGAD